MRVLACPLAGHGYVYPMLGVAEHLQAGGHEVTFVTGHAFAEDIAEAGFVRFAAGRKDVSTFEVYAWGRQYGIAAQALHVELAMCSYQPDVVLTSQLALGAMIASERHGVPVVVLGLGAYLYPRLGCKSPGVSDLDRLAWWRFDSMRGRFDRARQTFHLGADDPSPESTRLLGDRFLLQSCAELEGETSSLPPRVTMVGDCEWEPATARDADLTDWLTADDPRPIVYTQHGRVFDQPKFLDLLLDAASRLPIRLVVAAGKLGSEAPEPMTSPDVFLRSHVPQGAVLPHVCGAVANGNTTVVLGALSRGLPLVLFPAGNEHPEMADRCARGGAAVVVKSEDITTATVRASLEQLISDSSLGIRAAALADSFARMGRFSAVSDALVDVATGP